MEYKKYGIYANDKDVSIIIDLNKDYMLCVEFPIENFSIISNNGINICIEDHFEESIVDCQIFTIDLHEFGDIFNNHGYGFLGLINNEVKNILIDYIQGIIEDEDSEYYYKDLGFNICK